MDVDKAIEWSYSVFDNLEPEKEYKLAFSGGKDSHALLAVYLSWCESRNRKLRITVVFSDTRMESASLLSLVDSVEKICNKKGIRFQRTEPTADKSFWVKLIGYGYPVPDHQNRWCTGKLKVEPMKLIANCIAITGAHKGESVKRDKRLNKTCGSSECGLSDISNAIEPLAEWRNCTVWDFLLLYGDRLLYTGLFDALHKIYDLAEDDEGSLRMGCFACPVVGFSKISDQAKQGIIPDFAIDIRCILEWLRAAPRINNPILKASGAILVDARLQAWEILQQYLPSLLAEGWIQEREILLINQLLEGRAYPPLYKDGWIAEQEVRAVPWKKARSNLFFTQEDMTFMNLPVRILSEKIEVKAIQGKMGAFFYYVCCVPFDAISTMQFVDESELSEMGRSQRPIDLKRVRGVKDYILNSSDYMLGEVTVGVDSLEWDETTGVLTVPTNKALRIVDGQHRIRAIQSLAPGFENDHLCVRFIQGGIERCRQVFTDYNNNTKTPAPSLSIAYDFRNEAAIIANYIRFEIPWLNRFVEAQKSTVSTRSTRLFTLKHLYDATLLYLSERGLEGLQTRKQASFDLWTEVYDSLPEFQDVYNKEIRVSEFRQELLLGQAVTLKAIAHTAAHLHNHGCSLRGLKSIDWSRDNPFWVGNLIDTEGKMQASKTAALSASRKILETLGVKKDDCINSVQQEAINI